MSNFSRLTDLVAQRRTSILEFSRKALKLQDELSAKYAALLGAGPQDAVHVPVEIKDRRTEEKLNDYALLTPLGVKFTIRTILDGVWFDSETLIKPNGEHLAVENDGQTLTIVDVGHIDQWAQTQIRELEKKVHKLGVGALIATGKAE